MVDISQHPTGMDAAWVARDETGCVAFFITAGEGPIPEVALQQLQGDIWPEELMAGLAKIGSCVLHVVVPNPSSFVALAERGVFVYDWSDIHRTEVDALGAYERVASPGATINVESLKAALGWSAGEIPLICESFVQSTNVKVEGVKA